MYDKQHNTAIIGIMLDLEWHRRPNLVLPPLEGVDGQARASVVGSRPFTKYHLPPNHNWGVLFLQSYNIFERSLPKVWNGISRFLVWSIGSTWKGYKPPRLVASKIRWIIPRLLKLPLHFWNIPILHLNFPVSINSGNLTIFQITTQYSHLQAGS